jgi:hypothetical protein
MFKLFKDLITGDLQPYLIDDNNICVLENLLKGKEVLFYNEHQTLISNSDYFKINGEEYILGRYEIYQKDLDKGDLYKTTFDFLPEDHMKALKNLDIFNPPNYRAELYLLLMQREISSIIHKISSFLHNSTDIKSNELFALKNIQILKGLAVDLRIYFQEVGIEDIDNFYDPDPDTFILNMLKFYIINLIQYIQRTFSPFCNFKVDSALKLKDELFNGNIIQAVWLSITAYLPEDKEFYDFIVKFGARILLKSLKPDIILSEISIGEGIFNIYKSKFQDFSKDIQLTKYREALYYWNELIISNKLKIHVIDKEINNPEIEEILIKLLKTKIEFLENELRMRVITHVNTSSKIVLTGFKCDLTDIQKKNLFNYLKDQKIIDKGTSEKHFNALLSEEELPQDFKNLKWILLNPKGGTHQQALRDFFEVTLGEGNIPSDKTINNYFTDKSGNPIKFSKPNGKSNYLNDFETVVNPK